MATTEQLQTWLAEAETARHELALGVRAVSISSSSGKSVSYTEAGTGGPVLLLIHGMGGSSENWRAVIEPLDLE